MLRISKKTLVVGALAAAIGCGGDEPADGNNTQDNITCEGDVCSVRGTLLEDVTFTADKKWLLRGGVFVGNDVDETILTIEPGTTIYGDSAGLSFLVVTRGSKINAEGTAEAPIVMTSAKAVGSRARGDWGGLVLNGRAPVNNCSTGVCEAEGEGGTGKYGGNQPNDDSGVLRYVRVEFAGSLISPDNELNGISFQGVGSGTTLEYIQVHMSKDDGVEFYGGTVNFKYILTTGIGDDSLDWTDGWIGKGQYFIAQQYEDNGDNGIEADNNSEDNARTPRSNPTLSNVTLLGAPMGAGSDIGVLLREGTGADLSNFVVTGFNEGCLDIDNQETFTAGQISMRHSVIFCNAMNSAAVDFVEDETDFTPPFTVEEWFTMGEGNAVKDPVLMGWVPGPASSLLSGGVAPSDPFFDKVDFIGAVGAQDWTLGWTISARN